MWSHKEDLIIYSQVFSLQKAFSVFDFEILFTLKRREKGILAYTPWRIIVRVFYDRDSIFYFLSPIWDFLTLPQLVSIFTDKALPNRLSSSS